MNWTERIGIEGAETMIAFLSKHFGIERPKIQKGRRGYASRGNSGRYDPRKRSICLGPDCQPWAVAHEFTHHFDYAQVNFRSIREPHSIPFYRKLKLVIAAIGDEAMYPWNKEYKQIQRWAKKDGLFLLTQWVPLHTMALSEISDGDKQCKQENYSKL